MEEEAPRKDANKELVHPSETTQIDETTQTNDKIQKFDLKAVENDSTDSSSQMVEITSINQKSRPQEDLLHTSELHAMSVTKDTCMHQVVTSKSNEICLLESSAEDVDMRVLLKDLVCEPNTVDHVQPQSWSKMPLSKFGQDCIEQILSISAENLSKDIVGNQEVGATQDGSKSDLLAQEIGLWDLSESTVLIEFDNESLDIASSHGNVMAKVIEEGPEEVEEDFGFFADELVDCSLRVSEKEIEDESPHSLQSSIDKQQKEIFDEEGVTSSPRKLISPEKVTQENQQITIGSEDAAQDLTSRTNMGLLPDISGMLYTQETTLRENFKQELHGFTVTQKLQEAKSPRDSQDVKTGSSSTEAAEVFNSVHPFSVQLGDIRHAHKITSSQPYTVKPNTEELTSAVEKVDKFITHQMSAGQHNNACPTLTLAIRNNELIKIAEMERYEDRIHSPGIR
jgi:hypothetical protein